MAKIFFLKTMVRRNSSISTTLNTLKTKLAPNSLSPRIKFLRFFLRYKKLIYARSYRSYGTQPASGYTEALLEALFLKTRSLRYQESLQVLPGPAYFKTKDSVKTFVCVFCQGVVSLVIGEFLEFQVR